MNIVLYNVTDSENVINKTLDDGLNISINLRNNTDLNQFDILLTLIDGYNFDDYNYCHMAELNRFYFISDIEKVNHKVYRLSLICDVLESYKDDILNSLARFKRNIKDGDYINGTLDYSSFSSVEKFASDITIGDEKTLILTTVGG